MAPNTAASQTSVGPSKLQIAFALAVLKSKPDGIAVRDYILQLRNHLRQGRQPIAEDSQHRHLDSTAYWREQYEKADTKCQELQGRIIQLERETETLQRRADVESVNASTTASSKRKRDAGKQTNSKSLKRARLSQEKSSDSLAVAVQDTFADDLDVLDGLGEGKQYALPPQKVLTTMDVAGTTLTQSLYTIHKLYKHQHSDPEAICFNLAQTSRAIGSVISSVSKHRSRRIFHIAAGNQRASTPLEKEQSELSSIIRASARAFTSLLVGLNKISSNDTGNRLSSLVIYECVKMFQRVLNSITESARSTASARTTSQQNSNKGRTKATSSGKDANPSRTLAQFLNALISYLDKSDPNHRELFEGFLFVLLERIGKRLFYCTFDRDRSATVDGDIAFPTAHDHSAVIATKETEALAIRLEAPSLIIILERAVALAPYHLNTRSTSTTSASKPAKSTNLARPSTTKPLLYASRTPLSEQAKDRLQRTLINCMFGEETHDEFSDVLRMPARLGGLPAVQKVDDGDVGEWFRGEIWRLVGWDLLGREGEW
ncbi:hypothetical protein K469DRAFT_590807 [Zopfia rhizophila CBS 207.26]|uniref:Uncharacterized protein n=1 Tax=Zopfia rhizophila CBS 207.26 TaxID=1314779 RepID=A0A6A6DSG9_9PEZI|nr:hypothetical protein K469DRAFT_590807 [Zopfia rhizophila CBS 207.26]